VADHPVKVPAELFTEWLSEALLQHDAKSGAVDAMVADKAAQWAADQELDAVMAELKALNLPEGYANRLRAARRPKPPSLAEQGMEVVRELEALEVFADLDGREAGRLFGVLEEALDRLAELEAQQ